MKDDLWVVVDQISGQGEHAARLHWLGGAYPHDYTPAEGTLRLATPAGPFTVTVLDLEGRAVAGDVVRGSSDPPRGWLSRYYGEKIPVPSLGVERSGPLPLTLVTLLAPERPDIEVQGTAWTVTVGGVRSRFQLQEGRFEDIGVERAEPARRAVP